MKSSMEATLRRSGRHENGNIWWNLTDCEGGKVRKKYNKGEQQREKTDYTHTLYILCVRVWSTVKSTTHTNKCILQKME